MNQALYDLPEGWEWVSLETIFDTKGFAVGKIPKADFGNEGSIPIIDQSQNFIAGYTETSDAYVGRLPVIVYGDHTNSLKYIDFKFICGADGTKVLSPKESVYARYAYYVLERFKPETLGYRRHFPILKTVRFPLPPLAEQTRIVEKLDAVLSRIDTAINELQQSLALVDAMFKSGLDKAFNPLCSPTNEAGLYDLPDGWGWTTWQQSVDVKNGKDYKAVQDNNGRYPVYGSGGVMAYASDYLCNENSVVIGRKGTINNPLFVKEKFWNIDTAFGLEAKQEQLMPLYLYYFCLSFNFIKLNTSTTLPSLTKSNLLGISMPLPNLAEQQQVVKALDALNDKTSQLKTELTAKIGMFNQLKASVLDGAFRGEV